MGRWEGKPMKLENLVGKCLALWGLGGIVDYTGTELSRTYVGTDEFKVWSTVVWACSTLVSLVVPIILKITIQRITISIIQQSGK